VVVAGISASLHVRLCNRTWVRNCASPSAPSVVKCQALSHNTVRTFHRRSIVISQCLWSVSAQSLGAKVVVYLAREKLDSGIVRFEKLKVKCSNCFDEHHTTKFVWLTQNSAFGAMALAGGAPNGKNGWCQPEAPLPSLFSLSRVQSCWRPAHSPIPTRAGGWTLGWQVVVSFGSFWNTLAKCRRPPGPCCARCVGSPQSANGMPGMPRSVRVIALAVFIALCLCSRTVRRVWATACLCHSLCALTRPVFAPVGQ
jgi:hypothetical protein